MGVKYTISFHVQKDDSLWDKTKKFATEFYKMLGDTYFDISYDEDTQENIIISSKKANNDGYDLIEIKTATNIESNYLQIPINIYCSSEQILSLTINGGTSYKNTYTSGVSGATGTDYTYDFYICKNEDTFNLKMLFNVSNVTTGTYLGYLKFGDNRGFITPTGKAYYHDGTELIDAYYLNMNITLPNMAIGNTCFLMPATLSNASGLTDIPIDNMYYANGNFKENVEYVIDDEVYYCLAVSSTTASVVTAILFKENIERK